MVELIGFICLLVIAFAVLYLRTLIKQSVESEVKSVYDLKLEQFKADLTRQNSVEVEKLRSQLSTTAAERHLRFSKLHERRAEVIAKTYELVTELHRAMLSYVNYAQTGATTDDERRKTATDAYNSLLKYFPPNAIFLPKVTAQKVDELRLLYMKNFIQFFYGVENEATRAAADHTKRWVEISDRVENLNATVVAELEVELRQLLGDDPTPGT
jgi:hypothetical protein